MIYLLYPFVALAVFCVTVLRLLWYGARAIPLLAKRKPRVIER